ncbi:hypothetical protein B0A48_02861 [Cryoendolithus antarcticus]|uniref:BHLH domain-containing protein n=1 Tax=Cryoendolithus antarcticus TaxID=1507870 RepID=A0A1V8TLH1_9PEZI|nr:hypothetical protein B0A48_02861 [Cryoendolithus antarcticus]
MFSDGYGLCHQDNPESRPGTLLWQQTAGSMQSMQLPRHLQQSLITPPLQMGEVAQQSHLPTISPPFQFRQGTHALPPPPCTPYLSTPIPSGGSSCPGEMDYGFPHAPSYLQSAQTSSAHSSGVMITPQSTNLPGAEPRPVVESPPISAGSSTTANDGRSKSRRPPLKRTSREPSTKPSRVPHSVVERRYRNNLRSQLDTLTSKVPVLKDNYPCALDIEDSSRSVKGPSKAVVISAAVKHIERLEADNVRAADFVRSLQDQIQGLQRLI